MERHVVVGTAGHIDHGKTALVKALTGVDTDRLIEEQRRGITIDLGFAPLALGAGIEASVVDVPGHEGFIRNMVAGATGVDLALLVVAADEGVMPQTVEHLAILRFLGVARGVVALTKCDLAPDPAWRALVADEIRERIAAAFASAPGSPSWPIVEVSATARTGLDELRAALEAEARRVRGRDAADRFRLPVDRAFSLPGAGTVVTGTLWSGTAAEADRLTLLPAGREVRVRSIEVHDRPAERALPGRRTALALVGPSRDEVTRGDVLVSGDGWRAGRAIDAELTLLPEARERLKPRVRVRVHHGTAEVLARVVPSEDAAPDDECVAARLLLESPLVARAGDRFVVRSYSPVTTIGGGVVVDPWADELPAARGKGSRSYPPFPDADAGLVDLLVRRRGARGLSRVQLEVAAGLDRARLDAAVRASLGEGLVEAAGSLVAAAEVEELGRRLARALEEYHAAHPLEPGMPAQSWRAVGSAAPDAVVELAAARLVESGAVARDGSLVRRAGWGPRLSVDTARLKAAILAALEAAGPEPPTVAELAAANEGADVPGLLRLMAREGAVVAVGRDRYYEATALRGERDRVVAIVRELGAATPAQVRERLGRSRKWLIPLLEWCDAQGITVRRGDQRTLGSGAAA